MWILVKCKYVIDNSYTDLYADSILRGKNIRDLLREKWLLCSVSGKCFIELCIMRKCFLCFPFENRMFSIRETYVSQGGNIRFPCGEHRNPKHKWVFMLRRFWVYIKGEKRRLARNNKSYWEPVVFIFRLAWNRFIICRRSMCTLLIINSIAL